MHSPTVRHICADSNAMHRLAGLCRYGIKIMEHMVSVNSSMRSWTICSHLGSTMAGSFVLLLSPSSAVTAACSSSMPGLSQWTHCLLRCLALSVFSSILSIRLRRSVGGVLHLMLSATVVTSMVGGSSVSPDRSSCNSVSLLQQT